MQAVPLVIEQPKKIQQHFNNNNNNTVFGVDKKRQQLNQQNNNNIINNNNQKKKKVAVIPENGTTGLQLDSKDHIEVYAGSNTSAGSHGPDALFVIPRDDVYQLPPTAGRDTVKKLQLCPDFDAENPDTSCGQGARCRFVHASTENAYFQDVHVNYAYHSLDDVCYERFVAVPGGEQCLCVAPPNENIGQDNIPMGMMLKTRALESNRKVLSHCAHYFFNRTCNRGSSCFFIHGISLTPSKEDPSRKSWGRTQAIRSGAASANNNNGGDNSNRASKKQQRRAKKQQQQQLAANNGVSIASDQQGENAAAGNEEDARSPCKDTSSLHLPSAEVSALDASQSNCATPAVGQLNMIPQQHNPHYYHHHPQPHQHQHQFNQHQCSSPTPAGGSSPSCIAAGYANSQQGTPAVWSDLHHQQQSNSAYTSNVNSITNASLGPAMPLPRTSSLSGMGSLAHMHMASMNSLSSQSLSAHLGFYGGESDDEVTEDVAHCGAAAIVAPTATAYGRYFPSVPAHRHRDSSDDGDGVVRPISSAGSTPSKPPVSPASPTRRQHNPYSWTRPTVHKLVVS